MPTFQQKLLQLMNEAIDFEAADPRTIWDRIFKSILFKMDHAQAIHWVIDGLDEADDHKTLVRLLGDIALSSMTLRVLLVSRSTSEIRAMVAKVPQGLNITTMSIEGHEEDLYRFILRELTIPSSADFQQGVLQKILEKAQNNFLVSPVLCGPLLRSSTD